MLWFCWKVTAYWVTRLRDFVVLFSAVKHFFIIAPASISRLPLVFFLLGRRLWIWNKVKLIFTPCLNSSPAGKWWAKNWHFSTSFYHRRNSFVSNGAVHVFVFQSVTLHTDLGDIKLELFCEDCPKACQVWHGKCVPWMSEFTNCFFRISWPYVRAGTTTTVYFIG